MKNSQSQPISLKKNLKKKYFKYISLISQYNYQVLTVSLIIAFRMSQFLIRLTSFLFPSRLNEKSSKIYINLSLIGIPEAKRIKIEKAMTGGQLKRYIYNNLSQELSVDCMSLYHEGIEITSDKRLSELLVPETELNIIQSKISITSISKIFVDAEGIDPITQQVGTAKMPCGHFIGKHCMTALVQSLIQKNKYEIRCPFYDEDGRPCLAIWDYTICKKIGVFTKSEIAEFQNGFNNNWIKEFAKICPKCNQSISKGKLETNRVMCPSCYYGDFCYLCLNKWKSMNNQFCGNEQCTFLKDFIENSPINKKFQLSDPNEQGQWKEYLTPQYRSCVHCFAIIEHQKSCKHMQCKSCKKSFCWVCLSVPNNGNYPCGSYDDYCGNVAERQKFGKQS